MSGWIGLDLDGTLALYDHNRGMEHIGKPLEPMLARIEQWQQADIELRIFTARATEPDFFSGIQQWLEQYDFPQWEITNRKDFDLLQIWDDRAITVTTNQGIIETPQHFLSLDNSGWLGIELDGTLAFHQIGSGIDDIGAPIEPMLNKVKQLHMAGMQIKIFTARAILKSQHQLIQDWLDNVGLAELEITAEKDFEMMQFWDDRAVHVESNTGQPTSMPKEFLPQPRYGKSIA